MSYSWHQRKKKGGGESVGKGRKNGARRGVRWGIKMKVRERSKEEVVGGASGDMRASGGMRRCERGNMGPVGERRKKGRGEKGS